MRIFLYELFNFELALNFCSRPDTSFNWISNPVQSVKKILWPQIRKFVIVLVLLLVLVMAIGLIVVNLPQKIAEHAIGL